MSIVDKGTYLAKAVTPIAWIKSGKKQTPGVTITFEITQDGPSKGQRLEYTKWVTPNTESFVQQGLAAAGYDGERDDSVVGKEAYIVVDHEGYVTNDGAEKQRAVIAFVNSSAGTADRLERLQGAELVGVKDRLRRAAAVAKAGSVKRDTDPDF